MKDKQFVFILIMLSISQIIGQFIPPFSMIIGTPFIVPLASILICFSHVDEYARFDFEMKSIIVILVTIISAIIDYLYAPGTHDQVGFAWMTLYWSYGLFTIFIGLICAKFYIYFSFKKLGFNVWTLKTILEIIIFILIPLIYHNLLWSGKIVPIIGN
jgi:hypothetical protein